MLELLGIWKSYHDFASGNDIITLHLYIERVVPLFSTNLCVAIDFTQSLETESLSSTTRRSKTRQTEIKLKTDFHYTKTSKTKR